MKNGLKLSQSSRIRQTNSQLCLRMSSPFRGFVTIKNLPKNIYKTKCREDEKPMLVYEEYFNAGVSIYISHITIFTFATKLFIEN